ncbi:MAG: hypothetical protein ABIE70_05335 [bacterium]
MLGINQISVEFLSNYLWLVVVAALIGLTLAWWAYHRTNPPLPGYRRVIMAGLRTIAILALVLALAEPMLALTREYQRPLRVSVLMDRSASMDKPEAGLSRAARMDSMLVSRTFMRLSENADVTKWYFAADLSQDETQVTTEATAIGESIYRLAREQMTQPADHWLLLTDGNSNSGRQAAVAAAGVGIPISAVNVALEVGEFDVALADQQFNPVVFSGQPTQVQVRLAWSGAEGQRIPVILESDGRVLDQTTIVAEVEDGLGEVTLKYTPEAPGQQLLTLKIPDLPSEQSSTNNRRSFSVKVLRSRISVLLVSGRPDYEVGFLKRFLDRSDRHEVTFVCTGSKSGNLSGSIPSRQPDLNRFDLIILHDPDPRILDARQDVLTSYLADRGGAIWLMMGREFARRTCPEWLRQLLPISSTGAGSFTQFDFRAEPDESNLLHPVIRLADDQAAVRQAWADLPPFETLIPCDNVAADATLLAYYQRGEGQRYPVLGVRRQGPGKILASAALPFWTWGFVSLGLGEQAVFYDRFLEGSMAWLTISDDLEPVRAQPTKDVFTRGESVVFDGYAYDAGFRPLTDVLATVRLQAEADGDWTETDFVGLGEGRFRAGIDALAPGTYRWEAGFTKAGTTIRIQQGRLVVEEFALEEFDRRSDPATLAAIAQASGGSYYDLAQFERFVTDLAVRPVPVLDKTEAGLWGQWWLLLVFVASLGLEWIMRKINQLI